MWIDIEKPFWWDVPIWLASGKVDSIGLVNNHMQRDGMLTNEAWGKPRDRSRFRDPHGNGQWSEEIYYHVLNPACGFLPRPAAPRACCPIPVGYNRLYVWVDKNDFSYDAWWEAFKVGRVVVTNGPLIRPLANNRLPGHVFTAAAGEELDIEITLNLATRDPISYLDIVKDGRVVQSDATGRGGQDRPPAAGPIYRKRLGAGARRNGCRQDLSLCRDGAVVRGNRRTAEDQQSLGAILSRLDERIHREAQARRPCRAP